MINFPEQSEIVENFEVFPKILTTFALHPEAIENNDINNILTQGNGTLPNLEFSDASESQRTIIQEPEFNLVEKAFYVSFDSRYRNTDLYITSNSFRVNFSPTTNNFFYNSVYDSYGTLIVNERWVDYGFSDENSIQETFDNILKIELINVTVPNNVFFIGASVSLASPGAPVNIFKDIYFYLNIEELEGPYIGGNNLAYNSFAKIIIQGSNDYDQPLPTLFADGKTNGPDEFFLNNPTNKGKLNSMTLNFLNKNGYLNNFGIDKLYVGQFRPGYNPIYTGYCGYKEPVTHINIDLNNWNYVKYCSPYQLGANVEGRSCSFLNSTSLQKGDLIYFYNMLPINDQINYFESYIIPEIVVLQNGEVIISAYYMRDNILKSKTANECNNSKEINESNEKIYVNFNEIFPENALLVDNSPINSKNSNIYYLVLSRKIENLNATDNINYFSVLSINSDKNVICNPLSPKNIQFILENPQGFKIGMGKKNFTGSNDDIPGSLFNKNGYYITNYQTNNVNIPYITINYNIKNTPSYIPYQCDIGYYGYNDIIFFIQDKLQIDYTFKITSMVKDYTELNSQLNVSGNN